MHQYTTELRGHQGRRIPVSIRVDRNARPSLLSVVALLRGRPVPMGHFAVRNGRVETHTSPEPLPLFQRMTLAVGAALGLYAIPDRYEVLTGLQATHTAHDLTARVDEPQDQVDHPALLTTQESGEDEAYVQGLIASENQRPAITPLRTMAEEEEAAWTGRLCPVQRRHENDLMMAYTMGVLSDRRSVCETLDDEHMHDPHLNYWQGSPLDSPSNTGHDGHPI